MLPFTKMHGLGNDYVYINAFDHDIADPADLARRMANRHTGVGSDGLILIAPSTAEGHRHGAVLRMEMYNADGSRGEMCGNGIRCVAKFGVDYGLVKPDADERIVVETDAGMRTLTVERPSGWVERVRVGMGEPAFEPDVIPTKLPANVTGEFSVLADPDNPPPPTDMIVAADIRSVMPYLDSPDTPENPGWPSQAGFDFGATCVSMGNPHVVFFADDVSVVPLESIGTIIENHPVFPKRVNAHIVQVVDRGEIIMRTWERGSGITQACGTGASAVCVAGVLRDKTDRTLLAHLPGGDLTLEWPHDDGEVFMTGPAVEVFHGEWLLER